jgi:hypothetical protein
LTWLRLAHLLLLGLWGGLVLCEIVIELASRSPEQHRHTARLHYLVDVLFELPLLAGILVTGALLARELWPLSRLHWLKIGCALGAIGLNLWCAWLVHLRHRDLGDPDQLARRTRQIRATALGVPLGAAALYLGLAHFHR